MEQKSDRKILKRIGAIVCALALTIVSFMLPYSTKFNAKNMIASADEVVTSYSFVSSDTYHFDVYYSGGSLSTVIPCLFSSNFNYVNGELSFLPNFNYIGVNGTNLNYYTQKYFKCNTTGQYYHYDNGYIPLVNEPLRFLAGGTQSDVQNGTGFLFDVYAEPGFNANVYKIDLYLSDTNSIITSPNNQFKLLNIKYTDLNDHSLTLSFYTPRTFVFNTRSYYLVTPDNLSDNQLYNQGYSAGSSAGYSAGETAGYTSGYSAGDIVGYNRGYSAGIDAANSYTFFSLVSAVIDAPIQAFMGLFNFELLGINLAGFFTGLLTLAFIITIVRLVMP